jgi:hypothetical protein
VVTITWVETTQSQDLSILKTRLQESTTSKFYINKRSFIENYCTLITTIKITLKNAKNDKAFGIMDTIQTIHIAIIKNKVFRQERLECHQIPSIQTTMPSDSINTDHNAINKDHI